MKNLDCLKYLIRHKWYVFLACRELGITWLGVVHDISKLRRSEWKHYTNHFHGVGNQEDFDYAWLLHQKRNKHHWQYWILREDEGETILLPMPDKYRKEMIADWIGAGRAISGRLDWHPWYEDNKHIIKLHPDTRAWIEKEL